MNIIKYRVLLKAVELGSFSLAAKELGYTQSGITHMMNSLENELGFQILLRGNYGVKLTENGKTLLPLIEEIVNSYEKLDAQIKNIKENGREVIKVGSYSSMTLNWLPSIVQSYGADFPNVRVDISTGTVDDIYSGLADGSFDLIFVSKNDKYTVNWIPLGKDTLLAVLPENHPFKGEKFPISEYEGARFLMPGLGFDLEISKIFIESGVSPEIIPTWLDDPYIISMVEHELGLSMLSELVLKGNAAAIRKLPLDPPFHRELGIAVNPSRERVPHIRKFIDYSKKFVENFKL